MSATMESLERERGLYAVIIEWDGLQPPRTFYRRLDKLAFRVRGDEEKSVIARRVNENETGLIIQEGCILCQSEKLARLVRNLAVEMLDEIVDYEGRTPTVSMGRVQLNHNFTRTRQDSEIMDRIQSVLGRRGRPPADEDWAVSCLECGRVGHVETWAPVNCPHCSGPFIHSRRGKPVKYADDGSDIFDLWIRSRFAGPHWEPVEQDPGAPAPPAEVEILNQREQRPVAVMGQSAATLDLIRTMPRQQGIDVLDAIFLNRAYKEYDERQRNRLEIALAYMSAGGTNIDLSETADRVDLVDAGSLFRREDIAGWLVARDSEGT